MSNFQRYTGYIYPLPQMTDEERFEYLGKVNEEATFDLDSDKFITEQLGDNKYLLWVTSSSYGKESGTFGSCRPCNQQEIYFHAPKFRKIIGEIDTAKLKYIDFCYYNSTECTTDYYLESELQKPMTLTEAIQHAKEVSASKCDECGKEHQQLAEWLQELIVQRDRVDVLTEQVKIYEAHLKKTQDSLMDVWEGKKESELKLASYADKTYITAEFLLRNGFILHEVDGKPDHEFANLCRDKDYYLYCDDVEEISAEIIDNEMGVWRVEVGFLDHGNTESLDICTIGQLRMFLAIEGLSELVKQFK